MVPFSFPQPPLKSRVMKKYSSTIEVSTPGVWRLKLGAFAHSCLPAFLILIMAPLSVFTLRLRVSVANPPSSIRSLKIQSNFRGFKVI